MHEHFKLALVHTVQYIYVYIYIYIYIQYCMHQRFKIFCKYWPDDRLLRPKLVVSSRIIIK